MSRSRSRPPSRQSTVKLPERSAAHSQSPETPSPQTNPPASSRVTRTGFWWIDLIANWFFRFLTLITVGYLVFDRIYETSAYVFSPASDPENPWVFPFTIANNSHVFSIKN